jgi:hypothetical protein
MARMFHNKLLCTQKGGGSTKSEKPFTGTTDFAILQPKRIAENATLRYQPKNVDVQYWIQKVASATSDFRAKSRR